MNLSAEMLRRHPEPWQVQTDVPVIVDADDNEVLRLDCPAGTVTDEVKMMMAICDLVNAFAANGTFTRGGY